MTFIPDPALRTVKLTVVVRSGRLELESPLQGTALKDGCHGELELPAFAILDERTLHYLTEERVIPFLRKKSLLLYRIRGLIEHRGFTKPRSQQRGGPFSYAVIVPQEVVLLRLQGTKLPGLEQVPCEVPALGDVRADSINHACTLLSEKFEPSRISHTANVFHNVFVEDPRRDLVSLDRLRGDREYLFAQRDLVK